MLESMWSSMSSSMQLAQECLERNGNEDVEIEMQSASSMDGLEKFAQTIDNSKRNTYLNFILFKQIILSSSFNTSKGEACRHCD
jgi:autophagy-related protein 2